MTSLRVEVDIPAASALSSPVRIGLRPTHVGGPTSTNTIPRSVTLPRTSSCEKLASAKATRRSNSCRNSLSGVSGRRSRDVQNLVTNSERETGSESRDHSVFSSAVIRKRTGPFPHASFRFSGAAGVVPRNFAYEVAREDISAGAGFPPEARLLRASSKATTAFFGYIEASIDALGTRVKYV